MYSFLQSIHNLIGIVSSFLLFFESFLFIFIYYKIQYKGKAATEYVLIISLEITW